MRSIFLLWIFVSSLMAPLAAFTEEAYQVDDRVSVGFNVRRANGEVKIVWLYPPALAEQVEAFETDDERSSFLRNEMQKIGESGHLASEYKLGYLYLHGIGVEQDLVEAERRFRIGLNEIERPIGACRLAEEMVWGAEKYRNYETAATLTLASLESGYKKASSVAEHIAYHYSDQLKPPQLEMAQRLYDASVAADPKNDRALYLSATIRLDRERYEEAWERATQVIELPEKSGYINRAHAIRLICAKEMEWEDRLSSDDIVLPLKDVFKRVPLSFVVVGTMVLLILPTTLLIFLTVQTRRKGELGAGVWTTLLWIFFITVIASIAIFQESKLIFLGSNILILIALFIAIHPSKRGIYFEQRSSGKAYRAIVDVLLCYGCFIVLMMLYASLYSLIFGTQPENQLICAFLREGGIVNKISLLVGISLFTPMIEEIVFRGFLIDAFRKKFSWLWAIVFSALIFGILHGLTAFIPIVILGVLTGYLRKKHDNLWPSISLHCLNNGISVLAIWLGLS